MVQHRKLNDRDPRLPVLSDKVMVKEFVQDKLGSDWVTPTLWQGRTLPDQPSWPRPFVVKSRHGCNQIAVVDDGNIHHWPEICARANAWVQTRYGRWLDEWAYEDIPAGLLVEPYIGVTGRFPVDYKLYVFGGKVAFVQVHLGRGHDHRWILFTPDWSRVSALTRDPDPAPPPSLNRMIAAAETLCIGFDFVRTDFYDVNGVPVFGEMTFYPGSGLDPFDPPELDHVIGHYWLRVRGIVPDTSETPASAPGIQARA